MKSMESWENLVGPLFIQKGGESNFVEFAVISAITAKYEV